MSDIRAIRQQLTPWTGNGRMPERFYVNDWADRLGPRLASYLQSHPRCPPLPIVLRFAKVWYDADANPHVDGLYDDGLRMFILREMRNEFEDYDPSLGGIGIDWPALIDGIPHEVSDGAYRAEYAGETWIIDEGFLESERRTNKAYLTADGHVSFESESCRLEELVLRLIADKVLKDGLPLSSGFLMTDVIIPEPPSIDGAVPSPLYDPPDPGPLDIDGLFGDSTPECLRWYDPHPDPPKPHPETKKTPEIPEDLVLRRLSPEETERMSRESAAETSQPMSRWTKREVMDVCRRAGVSEDALKVLDGMSLDDIRALFLIHEDTEVTGNMYDSSQQRHTRFWRLDIDAVRRLGGRQD